MTASHRYSLRCQRCKRLVRELDAEPGFDLLARDHFDGVPGAAVEERAVRAFARTLFAANTGGGVHFDATEWRVVFVGNPVHAVLDGAIGNASRRARAARATFRDDGELARYLLPRRRDALRLRLRLHHFADRNVILGHALPLVIPALWSFPRKRESNTTGLNLHLPKS